MRMRMIDEDEDEDDFVGIDLRDLDLFFFLVETRLPSPHHISGLTSRVQTFMIWFSKHNSQLIDK